MLSSPNPVSRRTFLKIAAASAAPLVLAACAVPQPAPAGGGEAAAPSGEKVAIRFLAMDYDSNMRPDTQALVDEFNSMQGAIETTLEVVSWGDGRNVLLTQMSAGQAPDVFNHAGQTVLQFQAEDQVEPLDELMGEELLANFWESGIAAMSVDGVLYGMPYFLDPRGLFYRTDLFEAAGLEAPETWADVREAAMALNDPPNMYGFGMSIAGPSGGTDQWWYAWVGAIGGGNNLSIWGDGGRSLVGNEVGVQAVQYMADLVVTDQTTQPSPVNAGRDEDLQPLFLAGQLAMVQTGSWLPTIIMNNSPDLQFGLAPLPVAEEGMAHANVFWPDAIMMAKDGEHKPETAEFMKFQYNFDNRLAFALQRGVIPERIDVGDSEAYLDPANPISEYNAIFVQEVQSAHNVFETPWPETGNADEKDVQDGVAKVFLGEASAADAMTAAAAAIDARHGL